MRNSLFENDVATISPEEKKKYYEKVKQRENEHTYMQQAVEKESSYAFTNEEILHNLNVEAQGRTLINYVPSIAHHQRHFYVITNGMIVRGSLMTWNEHL